MSTIRVLMLAAACAGLATAPAGAELVWYEGTGHYYEAVAESGGITWEEALAACENLGGTLATPTTQAENEFVYGLVDDLAFWFVDAYNNAIGPWLGGHQPDGSEEPAGNWQWLTGEAWEYTNWGFGEPNNFGGDEDALSYFGWGGAISSRWNDRGSTIALAYGYVFETVASSAPGSGAQLGLLALKAYPNPTRGDLRIQFSRPAARGGKLEVFDIGGRRVHSARVGKQATASSWDGRGPGGRALPGGVYLIRLDDGESLATARITLLR